MPFTETEEQALRLAKTGLLVSKIDDKTDIDCLGSILVPGRRVWNKLIKAGLVYETIEDPVTFEAEDGTPFSFTFTPTMELTDAGEQALRGL